MMKRFLLPILFCAFYFLAVYTEFSKIKINLLERPQQGRIELNIPEHPAARIVLLRFRNDSSLVSTITVEGIEHRIKANSNAVIFVAAKKTLSIESPSCLLERAELRNLYGSLGGVLSYVIVADDYGNYGSPGTIPAALLLVALIFLSAMVSGVPRIWSGLVLSFFILMLLVPAITRYRILFAQKTFFFLILPVYAPALKSIYFRVREFARARAQNRGVRYLHTGIVVATVFSFFLLQMNASLREFHGNYSAFLVLSEKYIQRNPLLFGRDDLKSQLVFHEKKGYDGQFFYTMAFDPFMREYSEKPRFYRRVVDNPPYRYGRIGFSILTKAFALDQPEFYPNVMIYLILVSHAIGAFFLTLIAIHFKRSPFWGLLYITIPAFTVALRVGLPEPLSGALLLGGVYFYLRRSWTPACIFFAAAVLVRETTAFFVVVIAVREWLRHNKAVSLSFSASLIPYALWRVYVGLRLFPTFKWGAFFYDSEGLKIPFAGIVSLYASIGRGEYVTEYEAAATVFPIFLVALFAISVFFLIRQRNFLSIALFGYSLVAICLDYERVLLLILSAERVTYEAFVLLLITLFSLKKESTFRIAMLVYVAFLFVYDIFFLTISPTFRAGFLWDRITS